MFTSRANAWPKCDTKSQRIHIMLRRLGGADQPSTSPRPEIHMLHAAFVHSERFIMCLYAALPATVTPSPHFHVIIVYYKV